MGRRIRFTHPAAPGERFAPGAFDAALGSTARFTIEGRDAGDCRLLAAEVAADGLSVALEIEVIDPADKAGP